MIIECDICEEVVNAEEISSCRDGIGIELPILGRIDTGTYCVSLLKCTSCGQILVAGQKFDRGGLPNSTPTRLWPNPEKNINADVPRGITLSLEEASRCFKAKAYLACAVMCGRTLEGILNEYAVKNKSLANGLQELLERGVIDKKIFEWGEALRKHRNIGAHFSNESINREDAKDLLDFANAICEYVFVLSKKFEMFMSRRVKENGNKESLLCIESYK